MLEFKSLLPDKKEQFSRVEVKNLLDTVYQLYLEELRTTTAQINELKQQNENWNLEHENSLVLIAENTAQKIELENLNLKLEEAFTQLEIESKTDYLTKLLNRGALIDALNAEIKRISRTKERLDKRIGEIKEHKIRNINARNLFTKNENLGKLVCAILDIDHFKQVNDLYGHLTGDKVLRKVGSVLRDYKILRRTDFSGRFGGEEFLIILPLTCGRNAMVPLQKLAEKIKSLNFRADSERIFSISVSIGVAEYLDSDKTIEALIKRADDALYQAKRCGRDRIVLYNELPTGAN